MEQVPPARLQVGVEGRVTLPLPPLWTEKVTVAADTVPLVAATVAEHVEVVAIVMGDVHATVVVVGNP
jgi:hypothetical protein